MPVSRATLEGALDWALQVEPSLVQEAKLWPGGQVEEEDGLSADQSCLLGTAMAGQEVLVPLLVVLLSPPSLVPPQPVLPFEFLSVRAALPDLKCVV